MSRWSSFETETRYRLTPVDLALFVCDVFHTSFSSVLGTIHRRSSVGPITWYCLAPFDSALFANDIHHSNLLAVFATDGFLSALSKRRHKFSTSAFRVLDIIHSQFPSMLGTILFFFGIFGSPICKFVTIRVLASRVHDIAHSLFFSMWTTIQ